MRELDPAIKKWREQRLSQNYVYIILGAFYLCIRENGEVVKRISFKASQ